MIIGNKQSNMSFLDEVMWLMAVVEEDWKNPSQRVLFDGLIKILFDSSSYGLGKLILSK
jgi:hypothetical protein